MNTLYNHNHNHNSLKINDEYRSSTFPLRRAAAGPTGTTAQRRGGRRRAGGVPWPLLRASAAANSRSQHLRS